MKDNLAWWMSYAGSRAASVVETPGDAGIMAAVAVALERGCGGKGELRATFLPARKMEADVPRRLWYRLRTVEDWRANGVDAETDAVPPGMDPCPLCLAELSLRS